MKMEIIEKKENPILKRDEIKIRVEHSKGKTPDRKSIILEAEKLLSTKRELFVIRKIQTIYGMPSSIVSINRYKNRKELEDNEPKYILKRNEIKEENKEEAENNG